MNSKHNPLKKGDRVNIYHDPITEENLEGEVILHKKLGGSTNFYDYAIERWLVKFIADIDLDDSLYERDIKVPIEITSEDLDQEQSEFEDPRDRDE